MSPFWRLMAVWAVLGMGCSCTVGTADFSVMRKRVAYDKPLAPGARIEVRLDSHLRLSNPFDMRQIDVEFVSGSSTDPGVATFGPLHNLGYTNGLGRDITKPGVTAVGPGKATLTVTGELRGRRHAEQLQVEVVEANWAYTVSGEPLADDSVAKRGEKVRVALSATDAEGRPLIVYGAHFDDDFVWVSMGRDGLQVEATSTCSGESLRLAKDSRVIRCVD